MALGQLGLNLAPLIAGAGIVGVAIGFGAQTLVRDFLSGLFILLEDQYGIGDTIDLRAEVVGVVEEVNLRVTRIKGADGTVWFVPNGEIRRVGNKSINPPKPSPRVGSDRGCYRGICRGWMEKVAERVPDQLRRGQRTRAAVAVYADGRPVVDLWGGVADTTTGRPWEQDSIVLVFSATKGMTAILASLLATR